MKIIKRMVAILLLMTILSGMPPAIKDLKY